MKDWSSTMTLKRTAKLTLLPLTSTHSQVLTWEVCPIWFALLTLCWGARMFRTLKDLLMMVESVFSFILRGGGGG